MTTENAFVCIVQMRKVIEVLDPATRIDLANLLLDGFCHKCGRKLTEQGYCTGCKALEPVCNEKN